MTDRGQRPPCAKASAKRQRAFASWLGVLRLWSLTASTVPVLVGAALAALDGRFSWSLLALTLLSGWLLQTATNLFNTYGDFKSGVDSAARLPTAPQLVTGELRPRAVFASGAAALLLGGGLGVAAAALSDWRLLLFAAAGAAGAAGYTTGVRFKYSGLGVPMVALLMGVLMVTASYFAQARTVSWACLVASLPVASLVAAVLHGNDLRDIETDRTAKIKTTTLVIGAPAARALFCVLHLAAYLVLASGVLARLLPAWSLLVLLALPLSLGAIKTCSGGFRAGDADRIAKLEGQSAGTHFLFGVLFALGLVLAHLLG